MYLLVILNEDLDLVVLVWPVSKTKLCILDTPRTENFPSLINGSLRCSDTCRKKSSEQASTNIYRYRSAIGQIEILVLSALGNGYNSKTQWQVKIRFITHFIYNLNISKIVQNSLWSDRKTGLRVQQPGDNMTMLQNFIILHWRCGKAFSSKSYICK